MAEPLNQSGVRGGNADLLDAALRSRLDALDILSRRVVAGRLRGDRRSRRIGGNSNEAAGFRDYSPGDDPRFVDWNIYARLDRLLLKLFIREEELPVHMMVDCSASCDWGEPNKLLYIKRLAAALGYVALVNHHRVAIHGMPHSGSGMLHGRARIPRLLRFLADLPAGAAPGETGFEDFCRSFITALARRSAGGGGGGGAGVCIVLSDFLFREDISRGLAFLTTSGHDLFCLQVLAPQELEPQNAACFQPGGQTRLIDMEDRRAAATRISRESVEQYKTNLRHHSQRVQKEVERRGGRFLAARTDIPIDRLVLSCLREGRLLAGSAE
jgi:uncharacterized protein (DUF58 family)